jgi:hypothetical protein
MGSNIERITLDAIVEGERVFKSDGVTTLKVTRGGEIIALDIPIQSSGVNEIIEEFRSKEPQPPAKKAFISPDEEIGKQMGITEKQAMWISDFSDPDYVRAKEQYETDLGLRIVLQGIAIPIKDKAGNVVEDKDKRLEILKQMGLTGEHFSQMVRDIQSLTKWSEEEETRFLG